MGPPPFKKCTCFGPPPKDYPFDRRCPSPFCPFKKRRRQITINTTKITVHIESEPESSDISLSGEAEDNNTTTGNYCDTAIASAITTASCIAQKTEEITTKLDHVITLFDKIDVSVSTKSEHKQRSKKKSKKKKGTAKAHEGGVQTAAISTVAPMNTANLLVEVLDKVKDLRMHRELANPTSIFQVRERDFEDVNKMLVAGFIYQLDVAVSERLPYLNQTLDRVGVTLMARLLENKTQEEQTLQWQAEERRFQKEIEDLQIEKRRVERQLEEKETQFERLRENMAHSNGGVHMFNGATDTRIGGRTSINVNVVNYIIESR